MENKLKTLEENYLKALKEYEDCLAEIENQKKKEEEERIKKLEAEKEARIEEVVEAIMDAESKFKKLLNDYGKVKLKLPKECSFMFWS